MYVPEAFIILTKLGKEKGMLRQIFAPQNKIQDPAKLYKLIGLIDKESWVLMGADVKGEYCLNQDLQDYRISKMVVTDVNCNSCNMMS